MIGLPIDASLEARLADLGFTPLDGGDGYRKNGSILRPSGPWLVMEQRKPVEGDPLADLGGPGLWRNVPGDDGFQRVFELHPCTVAALDEASDTVDSSGLAGDRGVGTNPCADLFAWVSCTAKGDLPVGWEPPPLEEVEAWIGARGLTVRAGAHSAQGALAHGPDRLAVRFPMLGKVPADLSESRRQWLRALLLDLRARWRLIRMGLDDEGSVQAEIDLTGCPPGRVEGLFRVGIDSLRLIVEMAIASIALVIDPSVESLALDHQPDPETGDKKS